MAPENLNSRDSDYWDKVWEVVPEDSVHGGGITMVLTVLEGLLPGRALDLGCGALHQKCQKPATFDAGV